ncbi:hypothetical protein MICRO11B_80068 [Micrococcus luteus]|nr:hypothetical protein MICRO116_90017 [Micrococcus sp. 116]VXB87399.1 hypothetical protein MICRO11B_80068 [Micrococcus luteus]
MCEWIPPPRVDPSRASVPDRDPGDHCDACGAPPPSCSVWAVPRLGRVEWSPVRTVP